ncbi:MAG: hypothetical protein K1X75_08740 [Leptospirales bacterium]|nr:hypothetical protein [Leptospirales bacterium]
MRRLLPIALILTLTAGLGGAACADSDVCSSNDVNCQILASLLYQYPPLYMAGGTNCSIWRSFDGRNWTALNALPGCSAGAVNAMTYAGGLFVAVGDRGGNTCGLWTSRDGERWTQLSCVGASAALTGIAFGGGVFTIVGKGFAGGYESMYSADGGGSWLNLNYMDGAATAANSIESIAYIPRLNQFVAMQQQTQLTKARTPFGSWNTIGSAIGLDPAFVVNGPEINGTARLLVGGASGGSPVGRWSDDAAGLWTSATPVPFGGVAGAPFAAAYCHNRRFVIVRTACELSVSANGQSYDPAPFAVSGCSADLHAIACSDSGFLAGGANGTFLYSTTGLVSDWRVALSPASTAIVNAIATRTLSF